MLQYLAMATTAWVLDPNPWSIERLDRRSGLQSRRRAPDWNILQCGVFLSNLHTTRRPKRCTSARTLAGWEYTSEQGDSICPFVVQKKATTDSSKLICSVPPSCRKHGQSLAKLLFCCQLCAGQVRHLQRPCQQGTIAKNLSGWGHNAQDCNLALRWGALTYVRIAAFHALGPGTSWKNKLIGWRLEDIGDILRLNEAKWDSNPTQPGKAAIPSKLWGVPRGHDY